MRRLKFQIERFQISDWHLLAMIAACARSVRTEGEMHAPPNRMQRSGSTGADRGRSEQAKSHFDGDNHRHWLSCGTHGWLEPPQPYCFDGLLFQSQAWALYDLNFNRAAVWRNHGLQNDGALVFRFAGLFRIFRSGAINTSREPDAAGSRMIRSATRAAAGAWTKASAFAAANTSPSAATNAAATAGATRVTQHFG